MSDLTNCVRHNCRLVEGVGRRSDSFTPDAVDTKMLKNEVARYVPDMLMIGASGSKIGKTRFACELLRTFSKQFSIDGVKVTTVRERNGTCPRGGAGCGVCGSLSGNYEIVEEHDAAGRKDTSKLLSAGARRVFWLRAHREHIQEGAVELEECRGFGNPCICESNTMRLVIEPGIFLMVTQGSTMKDSAREVLGFADRILTIEKDNLKFDLSTISFREGSWLIRERASAIILAGGKSTRMGSDKALLSINGVPLIRSALQQLSPSFSEVLISSATTSQYGFCGARVVPDSESNLGPIGGIATAMESAVNDVCFVVACDIPRISVRVLRKMFRALSGADGVVPTIKGKIEPLFAIYTKRMLPAIRKAIASGERRIRMVYPECQIRYVEIDDPIINLNTREEYRRYLEM